MYTAFKKHENENQQMVESNKKTNQHTTKQQKSKRT